VNLTVTPETLTDEMIRREWRRAYELPRAEACRRILDCDTALHSDGTPAEIAGARQRICDVINRRDNARDRG